MEANTRALWVHGHSAWLETSVGFTIERFGYFVRIKGNGDNDAWLHYSLPTMLDGGFWTIDDVALQLRTWGEAAITKVDVWQGSSRLISAETALQSTHGAHRSEGDSGERVRIVRTGLRSPEPVTAAIGVSLLVQSNRARDAAAIGSVGVTLKLLP
ncbi:DUF6623 family protein [Nakamurella sp. GG22]